MLPEMFISSANAIVLLSLHHPFFKASFLQ